MDINNLLVNYINQNIPKESFQENSVFQGEIVEIQGDVIFLEIMGKGIIQARSNLNLEDMIGEKIKFFISNRDESKIEIKPLIENSFKELTDKRDNPISNILKEYNIKETDLSKKLIKKLMKYDIPLKDNVINESIKTLDKIIELSQRDYEGLSFIDKNVEELNVNIKDIKTNIPKDPTIDNNQGKSIEKLTNQSELRDIIEGLPEIKKELLSDVKKILISDNPDRKEIELGKEIKGVFKKMNIKTGEKDFLDVVALLTKNKVKPSVNNIKNLKELIDDPIEFTKIFQKIRGEGLFKDIKEIPNEKGLMLSEELAKNKEVDKNFIKNILDEDIEKVKNLDNSLKKGELLELKEKTEFIKDLNREIYFHFIPLNIGDKGLDGLVNIIKDKKKEKSFKEGINIFISLDTNNLGNITISCQAKQDDLNIKVGIDEKDIEFFNMRKETLIDRIESLDFNISSLEFVFKEEISINSSLMLNKSPMHFLDIKV